MGKGQKWYHANIQCPTHGECDWIMRDDNQEEAKASLSKVIICDDCTKSLNFRELTPEEAHRAIFEPFFDDSYSMAVCLYS